MRRNSRTLLATAGAAVAAVLLIAGGLLVWGSAYVHNTVQGQLAAQQISFPPASAFAHAKAGTEITPSMIPSVSQYAGQQLLTGQQAEAYADHFIAVHVAEAGGGKTYSQLSTESLAQPDNAKLAATQVPTGNACAGALLSVRTEVAVPVTEDFGAEAGGFRDRGQPGRVIQVLAVQPDHVFAGHPVRA
jgi:hypothetical protein